MVVANCQRYRDEAVHVESTTHASSLTQLVRPPLGRMSLSRTGHANDADD